LLGRFDGTGGLGGIWTRMVGPNCYDPEGDIGLYR